MESVDDPRDEEESKEEEEVKEEEKEGKDLEEEEEDEAGDEEEEEAGEDAADEADGAAEEEADEEAGKKPAKKAAKKPTKKPAKDRYATWWFGYDWEKNLAWRSEPKEKAVQDPTDDVFVPAGAQGHDMVVARWPDGFTKSLSELTVDEYNARKSGIVQRESRRSKGGNAVHWSKIAKLADGRKLPLQVCTKKQKGRTDLIIVKVGGEQKLQVAIKQFEKAKDAIEFTTEIAEMLASGKTSVDAMYAVRDQRLEALQKKTPAAAATSTAPRRRRVAKAPETATGPETATKKEKKGKGAETAKVPLTATAPETATKEKGAKKRKKKDKENDTEECEGKAKLKDVKEDTKKQKVGVSKHKAQEAVQPADTEIDEDDEALMFRLFHLLLFLYVFIFIF